MQALNIISLIFLILVIVVAISLKVYTHRFLNEIDGLGDVADEDSEDANVILKL